VVTSNRLSNRLCHLLGLTKGDIIANATIFLAAGYESVSGALNYFFYIMSLKPDIQDKVNHNTFYLLHYFNLKQVFLLTHFHF